MVGNNPVAEANIEKIMHLVETEPPMRLSQSVATIANTVQKVAMSC